MESRTARAPAFTRWFRHRCRGLPVAEASTAEFARDSGVDYRRLDAVRAAPRANPLHVDAELLARYRSYAARHPTQPETFVARLPQATVVNERGYVVTAEGTLLRDVSRHYEPQPGQGTHRLMKPLAWAGFRSHRLAGRAVALTSDGAAIYYHWLLDLLPRLGALRRGADLAEIDHVVLPPKRLVAGDAVLNILGIGSDKFVSASRQTRWRPDELIVPSYLSAVMQPSRESVAFLRETVLPAVIAAVRPNVQPAERLYVRRAGRRRLLNEAEIEPVLQRFGFRPVHCEHLSLAEQMQLFSRAQFVVGVHGAGLANAVFCPPGAHLIELTVPAYPYFCFWDLAGAADLRFHAVLGSGALQPFERVDPNADVTISPQRLTEVLASAIATGTN